MAGATAGTTAAPMGKTIVFANSCDCAIPDIAVLTTLEDSAGSTAPLSGLAVDQEIGQPLASAKLRLQPSGLLTTS